MPRIQPVGRNKCSALRHQAVCILSAQCALLIAPYARYKRRCSRSSNVSSRLAAPSPSDSQRKGLGFRRGLIWWGGSSQLCVQFKTCLVRSWRGQFSTCYGPQCRELRYPFLHAREHLVKDGHVQVYGELFHLFVLRLGVGLSELRLEWRPSGELATPLRQLST